MNATKKNNGWILCPSKTFPGKYYYFNVLNGETAWSLDDAEKKILKRDGDIPKVTESHHHPEPSSPPIADPIVTTTVKLGQPKFSFMQHPTPVFGQSVFPKVLPSKPEEPNVIWTPIQIQVPIVLAPESRIQPNQVSQELDKDKPSKHKIGVQTFELNKEMYVQACATPLCQRFVNYNKTVIDFDKDNKIKNKEQFDKFYTSTPIKSSNPKICPTFKTIGSNTDQMFQSKINLSFSDLNPKITSQKPLIKKSVFNIQLPSKTPEKVFGSTYEKLKQVEAKVDTNKASNPLASSEPVLNFSDDLRNILLAKKRKFYEVKSNTGGIDSKRLKLSEEYVPQTKKKVTFNFDYESISSIEYDEEKDIFKEKYASTVETLRGLAAPGQRSREWGLVVDAEVLLDNFSFLDNFVQIDPQCKLVIPPAVISEVGAVSRGDCRGRARVTQARNIIRKLQNNHIIVQTADGEEFKSPPNDAILKTCIEAIDQNIHLILITNNPELQSTAKSYPIHWYSIQHIKDGLALKPKESGYKQMKITIHNDTDPNITQNGFAVHCYKKNIFGGEISNDIEKDDFLLNLKLDENSNFNENLISNGSAFERNTKIPNSKISNVNPKFSMTVNNDINSFESENESSKIYKQYSTILNKDSMVMDTNVISKMSNLSPVISIDHSTKDMVNTAPINWITHSRDANENSRVSNENSRIPIMNSKISLDHSTRDMTDIAPINWFTKSTNENENSMVSIENSRVSNENSRIPITNSKILLDHSTRDMTDTAPINWITKSTNENEKIRVSNENSSNFHKAWRYAPSDITATTIDVPMQNLNITEKTLYQRKTLEKTPTTLRTENKNSNETVSFYFQDPTPKFDFQKFKLPNKLTTSYFQNGREKSFKFKEQKQVPEKRSMPVLEMETVKPIFETNQTKEPQTTVFENRKENTHSKFEIDVFKKPQNIENGLKRINTNIDLSRFYVKNKVMENRLNERIDEWLCTYKQIMEESLSNILQKLSRAVLKSMFPPWSLYEALQCTKTVYKDHTYIKGIVDEICSCLYEPDCKMDKLKKNIIPSEFMKAIGYGINLIQYLKKILHHSDELTDSEDRLLRMVKQIEDPESDINEPLVKAPVISKTDDKEVRQNFVKNRTDIINYLKKHYPEWQACDNSKTKIVRIYGKDLNLLRLDKFNAGVENNCKFTEDYATKNVADATEKRLESTKIGKVALQNFVDASKGVANVATKNVDNILNTDTESLDCMIVIDTSPTKNVTDDPVSNELKNKRVLIKNDFKQADKHTENKNALKLRKTIDNKRVDPKAIEKYENAMPKPKTKSIFDFIKAVDTRKHEENQINNNLDRFKIDTDILAVKITVPNDYKKGLLQKNLQFNKEDEAVRKTTENKPVNLKYNINTKDIGKDKTTILKTHDIKSILKRTYQEKTNKNSAKAIDDTDKETGPKIIRNIHVIEKYEKRFERRNDNSDQDYTPINSSNDDDETHYSNNHSDGNSHQDSKTNDLKKHLDKPNDLNNKSGNVITECNINNRKEIAKDPSETDTDKKVKNVNHINDNDLKNDLKSDNERKNEKDDMTNDSGFGNESPHIYSVVKSFSSELNGSLELIRRFIDGCLQEFKEGKIEQGTKEMFRLKAFEANFLITKIIMRLNKLVHKGRKGKNGEIREKLTKNIEAVINCSEQAQILHKVLNTILTLTNEDGSLADLNSSMSLNLSS